MFRFKGPQIHIGISLQSSGITILKTIHYIKFSCIIFSYVLYFKCIIILVFIFSPGTCSEFKLLLLNYIVFYVCRGPSNISEIHQKAATWKANGAFAACGNGSSYERAPDQMYEAKGLLYWFPRWFSRLMYRAEICNRQTRGSLLEVFDTLQWTKPVWRGRYGLDLSMTLSEKGIWSQQSFC